MHARPRLGWLGWTLLYACSLWGLWIDAVLLAPHADNPIATRWVWVAAVVLPLTLAVVGAAGAETAWWTAIPPLVVGMSMLALTVLVWRTPTAVPAAIADPIMALLPGAGAAPLWVLFLSLSVLTPLLAYGLARFGLSLIRDQQGELRARLRGFARWCFIGLPLVTYGFATGDGLAVLVGSIALCLAGTFIGVQIRLWEYWR